MDYKYFDIDEFKCQETGENDIKPEFVFSLDALREECGFPFTITSGYRSPKHSIEAAKSKPGRHSEGVAADIAISNATQRHTLVANAIAMGFSGIGVAKTFVHLDIRNSDPVMWTY